MGRVTRRKVYDSIENESVKKSTTPRKSKRKRRGLNTSSATPTPKKQAPLTEDSPKKTLSSAVFSKQLSPCFDDGFTSSQFPCEVGWDTRNEFAGSNMRIADILSNLKNDSKENCGLEVMPSSPSLIDFLHSESPNRTDQTKTSMQVYRRTRSRTFQNKQFKTAMKSSDLLKRLQTVMSEFHKEEAETAEADVKASPRRITRSQKKQEENIVCEEKPLDESFDLFLTKPASTKKSLRIKQLLTNSQISSPQRNYSLDDDLWSDDDIADDSFVRVTCAIADQNGFVSPRCPSSKKWICHKEESPGAVGKRFTFTLDVDVENSVVGLPRRSLSEVVPSGKSTSSAGDGITTITATSVAIPDQYMEQSTTVSRSMTSSSSSSHSVLVTAPMSKSNTEKIAIQRHNSIPSDCSETKPYVLKTSVGQSSIACHSEGNQSEDIMNVSHKNCNVQANTEKTFKSKKQSNCTVQKSDFTFKKLNSKFQNTVKDSETGHSFKMPNHCVRLPAPRQVINKNIIPSVSGVKTWKTVASSSHPSNVALSWSASQFKATSTQLNGSSVNRQESSELRNNQINTKTGLSTITRPADQDSVNEMTVTTNQLRCHSSVTNNNPCDLGTADLSEADHPLDVSISDDLLASLAEPDDLLDSQACLELLQSPQDDISSSESAKQEQLCSTGRGKNTDPKSTEMDCHMLIVDCDAHTAENDCSITKAMDTNKVRDEDAEFDADDLGPDVLSMLDEVELRLSQEKMLTRSSVMTSKSSDSMTSMKPSNIKSAVLDQGVLYTMCSTSNCVSMNKERKNGLLPNVLLCSVDKKCAIFSSSDKIVESDGLTTSSRIMPAAVTLSESERAVNTSQSSTLNSSTCPPDEIERKRLEALKRRQNKLRLTRKCSKLAE